MLYNETTDKFVYKMQQLQLKISSSEMLLCCTMRQQTSFVYKMQQLQLKISSSEMLLCYTIRQQTSLYTRCNNRS